MKVLSLSLGKPIIRLIREALASPSGEASEGWGYINHSLNGYVVVKVRKVHKNYEVRIEIIAGAYEFEKQLGLIVLLSEEELQELINK